MDAGNTDTRGIYTAYRGPRETAFRLVHAELSNLLDECEKLAIPTEVVAAHLRTVLAMVQAGMEPEAVRLSEICSIHMAQELREAYKAEENNGALATPGYR